MYWNALIVGCSLALEYQLVCEKLGLLGLIFDWPFPGGADSCRGLGAG